MIKLIVICIGIYLLFVFFTKSIPLLVLKTKNVKIKNNIKSCFITEETDNYIFTYKSSINKYIFIFPGFASESLYLHRQCKYMYNLFGQTHNIIGLKYMTNYNSIDQLSSHLARVIATVIHNLSPSSNRTTTADRDAISYIDMDQIVDKISNYTIHVIGCSYGCSIAIDTFLKLQDKFGFPKLDSFTSYKSFNTFQRAIKHQNNIILKLLAKIYFNSNKFSYDNTNMMYLKTRKRYIVNHINDEIINKSAQFSYRFCKLNRIHLIYDTYMPSEFNSYFDYFFKCHIFFNTNIISSIIKD